ncbi:hypothetical protein MKY75_01430 [Paenibacillus sp. FSL L8-0663]|uniref:hypothetical protein n=1 Tax=Paenibacillus sp. FSL L8-0663 TaxID=2921606 RepID=UPI0030F7B86D
MKLCRKLLIPFVITAIFFSTLGFGKFAIAAQQVQADSSEESIILEIVKSDLEEKTYVVDGKVFNGFTNYKEAGVSEEAFEKFKEIITFTNENIEQGNITVGTNIKDIKANIVDKNCECSAAKSTTINPAISTNNILYSTYKIDGNTASKIGKVLAGGGGAAAVASMFGLPAAVAAVLSALYGANELCNWNNNGYTIYYTTLLGGVPQGFCVPN